MQQGSPQVAECVSTALHTEMVLYIVERYAQQRTVAAQAAARQQQRDAAMQQQQQQNEYDSYNENYYYSDGEDGGASDASGAQIYASGDVIYHTLENVGVHTGLRVAERLLCREPLASFLPDVVGRFVAGPLWLSVFGKPLEILPSGEYDVVELRDSNFRWIRSCAFRSVTDCATDTLHVAPGYAPDGTALVGGDDGQQQQTSSQRAGAGGPSPAPAAPAKKKDKGPTGTSEATMEVGIEEAGPADFVVYTCGLLRGVLQALGHPHAAVSFQVMAPAAMPQQQQHGGFDDGLANGGGANGGGAAGSNQFLNLSDVRFTLDFRAERPLMGRQ